MLQRIAVGAAATGSALLTPHHAVECALARSRSSGDSRALPQAAHRRVASATPLPGRPLAPGTRHRAWVSFALAARLASQVRPVRGRLAVGPACAPRAPWHLRAPGSRFCPRGGASPRALETQRIGQCERRPVPRSWAQTGNGSAQACLSPRPAPYGRRIFNSEAKGSWPV